MSAVETRSDLAVWRKSVTLASHVYRATGNFPEAERQGLALQMRRSALAAAAGIADGASRAVRLEYIRFLQSARGSLAELETLVHIAEQLGLLAAEPHLAEEIAGLRRSLAHLIRKLREQRVSGIAV